MAEEEYARSWFGLRYLGRGQILCGYCLETPCDFISWNSVYICTQCEKNIDQLGK